MVLKYTLSNIFQKPGRLIILMLCLIVACFFGFLSADFGGTMKNLLASNIYKGSGKADYLLVTLSKTGIEQEDFSGAGNYNLVYRQNFTKTEVERRESEYSYAISTEVKFWVFNDYEKACEMEICPQNMLPGIGEVTIGKEYSERFHINIGDTVTLKDTNDEDVAFKVIDIYEEPDSWKDSCTGLLSKESAYQLLGFTEFRGGFIDILDNDYKAFEEYMETEHPRVTFMSLYGNEALLKMLDNITYVVYLVFVLVFALVIFVTISFTEKILTERMSVIGTLRSIGMSMKQTTFILLFENVMYGFFGSILALILYLILRGSLESTLADKPGESVLGPVNIPLFLLVIIGAVLIEVMIPLKEVIGAVKTSIRDIIFENRDTECLISVKKTVMGTVFIVLGTAAGLLVDDVVLDILCILLIIIGGGMVIHILIRFFTEKLAVLFGKTQMPVAELAAIECGTKKTNIGNAKLAIVAVTASIAIFVLGSSMINAMNRPEYDTDVVVQTGGLRADDYAYLDDYESITEKEFIYYINDLIGYGTESKPGKGEYVKVWSLPVTDQYIAFGELPDHLEKDEIFLNRNAAQVFHIKKGDTIKLVFHNEGLFIREKEMKVAGVSREDSFGAGSVMFLNADAYKELYSDEVGMILIHSLAPDDLVHKLEAACTNDEVVKTNAKIQEEKEKENKTTNLILYILTFAAMGLTLVGISGNQVIGFLSRKKEYAMLHSTACSRKKIIRMIWVENAMLFGISVIAAALISIPVILMIAKVFRLTALGLYVEARFDTLAGCAVLLWLVTMLTARTPVRSLKKMNTAIEMKYE